jgi:hypothetical protein
LISPMRTILITLVMTLATQAGADTKKYGKKECNEISVVIDFLLSTTPNLWSKLEKNPTDEETALELSWTVDLAANYTTIYEVFCTSEE